MEKEKEREGDRLKSQQTRGSVVGVFHAEATVEADAHYDVRTPALNSSRRSA